MLDEVIKRKRSAEKEILSKPNVVGVAVGYKVVKGEKTDKLSITAFVRKKLPRSSLREYELVPEEVDGIPTDVVETGLFIIHNSRTSRIRPVPAGVSISHPNVGSGTLGLWVIDVNDGSILLLSCNHVIANENNASIGDPIIQPGTIYGGNVPDDVIANLKRFIPIDFTGNPNIVDVAVAEPVSMDIVDPRILELAVERLNRGEQYIADPYIGMKVYKSGATSGVTEGTVEYIDVTAQVEYISGTALFTNQIAIGPGEFSQPGDSGSAVLDDKARFIGLLFAGSDTLTLANPAKAVTDSIGIIVPYMELSLFNMSELLAKLAYVVGTSTLLISLSTMIIQASMLMLKQATYSVEHGVRNVY